MKTSIHTVCGEDYRFEGEDAKEVFKVIDEAGKRGSEWTVPAKLSNGSEITFVLRNIISFTVKESETNG